MTIEHLRASVVKLLEDDVYDEADKAWVVAVFVSLRTATTLDYQQDSFIRLSKKEKHDALLAIMSEDRLLPPQSSPSEQYWRAGHFYNNALFRIVALAETRLPVLYERHARGKPPEENYWELSKWYEETFAESLEHVNRARAQVNRLKHVPHYERLDPRAERLEEGIAAFREVIRLLWRVVAVKP